MNEWTAFEGVKDRPRVVKSHLGITDSRIKAWNLWKL